MSAHSDLIASQKTTTKVWKAVDVNGNAGPAEQRRRHAWHLTAGT